MSLDYLMYVLLGVFFVLQLLDIYTTNRALALGHREANPVVAAMMDRFGRYWWVPKLLLALSSAWAACYYLWVYTLGWLVLFALCVFYLMVVANNWMIIKEE